jgi:hypothetical protein
MSENKSLHRELSNHARLAMPRRELGVNKSSVAAACKVEM